MPETGSGVGTSDASWWRQAVVYQIYPRSFADSNGDGIGDLPGITARVPYLAELGIEAVWLSPFYPSALADGGYDVDDYRNVDPRLGTLQDFDDLVAALDEHGIRMIVDIVPNHTSDRHEWFVEALNSEPGSPARDRYIFRDGRGPDGAEPPSDWDFSFGGPSWTRVPDGQWYLHLFAPQQPDLNWANPEVHDDFLKTLRFWSDRGVAGFRIDVAHGLVKDLTEPLPGTAVLPDILTEGADHPLWDRDEVHDIYAEWRKVFNEYDPPRIGVAEAWVHRSRRVRYASAEGLGQAFSFDLLMADWEPAQFRQVITANLLESRQSGASSTWVLSNHDVIRHVTRYGLPAGAANPGIDSVGNAWLASGGTEPAVDEEASLRKARAATLLMLALPGSAYVYQGEELGLPEVADIPAESRQDPMFFRTNGELVGRDGCRVPLPWTTAGPTFGFGAGGSHLPAPSWFGRYAASWQELDPGSTLRLYQDALRLRRQLQGDEELEWVDDGDAVVHFIRPGGWHSITNFGPQLVALPAGKTLLSSGPLDDGKLPVDTTVWLRA
jgi:alpha-glucosidase